MEKNKTLYTVAETANYLRLSKGKVYALVRQNRLPNVTIDSRKLIPKDALFAWVEQKVKGV